MVDKHSWDFALFEQWRHLAHAVKVIVVEAQKQLCVPDDVAGALFVESEGDILQPRGRKLQRLWQLVRDDDGHIFAHVL